MRTRLASMLVMIILMVLLPLCALADIKGVTHIRLTQQPVMPPSLTTLVKVAM